MHVVSDLTCKRTAASCWYDWQNHNHTVYCKQSVLLYGLMMITNFSLCKHEGHTAGFKGLAVVIHMLTDTVSWSCPYSLGGLLKQPDNLLTIVCFCFHCVCVFRQWDGVHGRERWSPQEADGKMENWESGTQIRGLVWLLPTHSHRCWRVKVQQRFFHCLYQTEYSY